jgi:WD40 repeat protein
VAATGASAIDIWNTATGTIIRSIPITTSQNSLVFSADGRQLAAGGAGLAVWDVVSGNKIKQLASAEQSYTVLGFQSNDVLIAQNNGMSICYWNIITGSLFKTVRLEWPDSGIPVQVTGSADGLRAVGLVNDSTILYWDGITGSLLRTYPLVNRSIQCIAITPDGTSFASGGQGEQMQSMALLWRLDTIVRGRRSR